METSSKFQVQRIAESDFQVLKNLGEGTYGQVVMAHEKETGKMVALKMMKKNKTKLDSFLQELCISIYLSSYEGIIFTHSSYMVSGDHYIVIQDLAPAGTLHSLIQPDVGLPEVMVKRCALQLTRALQYMHSKGLVHRDLKPDNVLLMDKECHHIKLSDFGMTQMAGTLVPFMSPLIPYMSPELCALKPNETLVLDPSVDLWAFGVLLYFSFTGLYPWKRAVEHDRLFRKFIYWQNFMDDVPPPTNWTKLNGKIKALFHVLLSQDPKLRNPITSVLDHLDYSWEVEDVPEEILEEIVIEEGEVEMHESEIIVIDGEDEIIVVENYGDIEYIILSDTTEVSLSSSSDSTIMYFMEETSSVVGSEVEIM